MTHLVEYFFSDMPCGHQCKISPMARCHMAPCKICVLRCLTAKWCNITQPVLAGRNVATCCNFSLARCQVATTLCSICWLDGMWPLCATFLCKMPRGHAVQYFLGRYCMATLYNFHLVKYYVVILLPFLARHYVARYRASILYNTFWHNATWPPLCNILLAACPMAICPTSRQWQVATWPLCTICVTRCPAATLRNILRRDITLHATSLGGRNMISWLNFNRQDATRPLYASSI